MFAILLLSNLPLLFSQTTPGIVLSIVDTSRVSHGHIENNCVLNQALLNEHTIEALVSNEISDVSEVVFYVDATYYENELETPYFIRSNYDDFTPLVYPFPTGWHTVTAYAHVCTEWWYGGEICTTSNIVAETSVTFNTLDTLSGSDPLIAYPDTPEPEPEEAVKPVIPVIDNTTTSINVPIETWQNVTSILWEEYPQANSAGQTAAITTAVVGGSYGFFATCASSFLSLASVWLLVDYGQFAVTQASLCTALGSTSPLFSFTHSFSWLFGISGFFYTILKDFVRLLFPSLNPAIDGARIIVELLAPDLEPPTIDQFARLLNVPKEYLFPLAFCMYFLVLACTALLFALVSIVVVLLTTLARVENRVEYSHNSVALAIGISVRFQLIVYYLLTVSALYHIKEAPEKAFAGVVLVFLIFIFPATCWYLIDLAYSMWNSLKHSKDREK